MLPLREARELVKRGSSIYREPFVNLRTCGKISALYAIPFCPLSDLKVNEPLFLCLSM